VDCFGARVSGNGYTTVNINASGVIVGNYIDENGVNHGFQRSVSGNITTGNVPGAGTGSGQGTLPSSNDASGAITGSYIDAGDVYRGFLLIP
jgi:hypothetical protein